MPKPSREQIFIGRGILTWDPCERRTDRYGFIYLLLSGNSISGGFHPAPMKARAEHLGKRAMLQALVTEARTSTHIGDLFHGVFPSTPNVGDVIVLGTGLLCKGKGAEGNVTIGLRPFDDDRGEMWMDIKALYRCHEQTVELSYIPLEDDNA